MQKWAFSGFSKSLCAEGQIPAGLNGQELKPQSPCRLILLLGVARSGTTWLGNIMNSSPRSLYSSEAQLRLDDTELAEILHYAMRHGRLCNEERKRIIDAFSMAHPAIRRAPFFPKDFQRMPTS